MKTDARWLGFPFDPQKATEVAALLLRYENGSINMLKLVKLVYLLDRGSNGPVTSEILDLVNSGLLWHCDSTWAEFISARANHFLEKDPGTDNLSQFELWIPLLRPS